MAYSISQEHLGIIEGVLQKELMPLGLQTAILIDQAGNILVNIDNGKGDLDIHSLAALAAGNFGAVSAIAELIGEQEFSLLFNKGAKENLNFSKFLEDFLLVTVFGHDTTLGMLRLKIDGATQKLKTILEQ